MKSLLFILCFAVGPFTHASPSKYVPAFAMTAPDADPLITRSSIDGHSLQLALANLEGISTEVTITALDNGDRHFRELVKKHNGYRSGFDLADLDAGRYVITVTKGETVRRQVILITENGMMCSDWK